MSGTRVGMHSFGLSAPIKDVMEKFDFTPENVSAAAKDQILKSLRQAS
jgi:transketolase